MSTTCLSIRRPALDAQGFEALYREHLGLIYHYVYRKVGNRQEAEDLTSSIFLKAVRGLRQETDPQRMGHWLLRVARTTLIDYWRAHRARVTSSSLEALQEAGWEGPAERDPFGVDGRPTERVQGLLEALPDPAGSIDPRDGSEDGADGGQRESHAVSCAQTGGSPGRGMSGKLDRQQDETP